MKQAGLRHETECSFRIVHPDLDPSHVTSLLAIHPSLSHKRGEVRAGLRAPKPWRTGVWSLESSLGQDSRLSQHLISMLDILEPKAAAIKQLVSDGHRAEFFCGYFAAQESSGIDLEPEVLRRLGELGVGLTVCFYLLENEDKPARPEK